MKKEVDYIIVGIGLAGINFAEQLRQNNKSFIVISSLQESSSKVAGGMYNPVILKRFTLAWQTTSQLATAIPFYKQLEQTLNTSFVIPMPIYRIFNNIEEQNNWFVAADKPLLSPFLNTTLIDNQNDHILANYKFGHVNQAGRIEVDTLIEKYTSFLINKEQFIHESFDYTALEKQRYSYNYKNITAKYIVYCEGFGLRNNPYFNYLPLKPSKGETITIEAKELDIKSIIKSGVFMIPTKTKNQYLVGATYNWTDETWDNTTAGKNELIEKLNRFLKCEYTIIDQKAGIRPTVKDRRPLVGKHPKKENMYVLNGLGTRGVVVAPTVSEILFNHIENKTNIPLEIDIKRFEDYYNEN